MRLFSRVLSSARRQVTERVKISCSQTFTVLSLPNRAQQKQEYDACSSSQCKYSKYTYKDGSNERTYFTKKKEKKKEDIAVPLVVHCDVSHGTLARKNRNTFFSVVLEHFYKSILASEKQLKDTE